MLSPVSRPKSKLIGMMKSSMPPSSRTCPRDDARTFEVAIKAVDSICICNDHCLRPIQTFHKYGNTSRSNRVLFHDISLFSWQNILVICLALSVIQYNEHHLPKAMWLEHAMLAFSSLSPRLPKNLP